MQLMVCLVLTSLAILPAESQQDDSLDNRFTIEEQCVHELKLDRSKMQAAVNEPETAEDDENFGKFFACVWRKRHVMAANGAVSPDGFKRFLEEIYPEPGNPNEVYVMIVDKVVESCKQVQGKTQERTAVRLKNCMIQTVEKLRDEAAKNAQ